MQPRLTCILLALALLGTAAPRTGAADPGLTLSPYRFVSSSGDTIDAELGTLRVPENRENPGGRTIEISFVRFKGASESASPIIYLAGGPGSSGIRAARGSRFPLFMALRELGDVIALDQRGTGISSPNLECKEQVSFSTDLELTRTSELEGMRPPARACAESWRAQGVDLAGYNTNENADDLEDLRRALGATKLRLWAISYGTHLALTAIRRHPDSIERAILAGVEGPDHTLKLPSNTERLLTHFGDLAAKDPAVHAVLPDLVDGLRGALDRLERAPATVRVPDLSTKAEGDSVDFVLGRYEVEMFFAAALGAAETQPYFPAFVLAASRGNYTLLATFTLARLRSSEVGSAMTYAMDCASGATEARRKRVEREATRATLHDATNPVQHRLCDAWAVPDLGDRFRTPVRSRVPVLFISGTHDLNTPPSNADEVMRGFPNSARLILEGAGHSDPLFLSSPRILELIKEFLGGDRLPPTTRINVPFAFRMDLTELDRYLR